MRDARPLLFYLSAIVLLVALPCRLHSQSTIRWLKQFGGPQSETLHDVMPAPNGGFMAVGTTTSYLNSSTQLKAVYVVNTDSAGNLLWSGSVSRDYIVQAIRIFPTDSAGWLVVGNSRISPDAPKSNHRIWLARLDSAGEVLWEQTINAYSTFNLNDAILNQAGEIVLLGYVGTISYGPVAFAKVSTDGALLQAREYRYSPPHVLQSICPARSGGYIGVGFLQNTENNSRDVLVQRFSEEGDTLWSRTYGTETDEGANAVVENKSGGFTIGGYRKTSTSQLPMVMTVDANGNITEPISTIEINETGTLLALTVDPKSNQIVGMGQIGYFSFLTRLDPTGRLLSWTALPKANLSHLSGNGFKLLEDGVIIAGWTSTNGMMMRLDNNTSDVPAIPSDKELRMNLR